MTPKQHHLALVCRLSAILLVVSFFAHPTMITWLPMSIWMVIFLLGAVVCIAVELIVRFREGMTAANGVKKVGRDEMPSGESISNSSTTKSQ